VFEFADGLPDFEIAVAEPPFTRSPSGQPVEVEGSSFLEVVFQGGTAVTPDGELTFESDDLRPGYDLIREVRSQEDFEAVSSWVVGLASDEACFTATTLDDRVVIDVRTP
jgi:hypothetical protein